MDTSKLTNATVKKALNAWQNSDNTLFLSCFTKGAKLFDDGHPRDFSKFVSEACGQERFTTIDTVTNNGLPSLGNSIPSSGAISKRTSDSTWMPKEK